MKNKILSLKSRNNIFNYRVDLWIGVFIGNPPFSVVDNEGAHYDKALYLSEGNVLPEISSHHAGYYVPQSVYSLEVVFYTIRNKHGKINIYDISLC